jgi:hypothetical protein
MLLHCHSRKCNTTRDHKLKVDSNEAICMDCGETNNMVSDFMKVAMKSSGDVYRAAQGRGAFKYKCPKCTVDRGVKIVDERALCESCLQPLNLSGPMIEAIKTTLAPKPVSAAVAAAHEVEEEDDSKEPKAEMQKGVIKRHKESV